MCYLIYESAAICPVYFSLWLASPGYFFLGVPNYAEKQNKHVYALISIHIDNTTLLLQLFIHHWKFNYPLNSIPCLIYISQDIF